MSPLSAPLVSVPDGYEGVLPGSPSPFVLHRGEGEKSVLFDNLFTVLLSANETEGQYSAVTVHGHAGERIPAHYHALTHEFFYIIDGSISLWLDDQKDYHSLTVLEPGDFGFVPKNIVHSYRIDSDDTKMFGVGTGDFMRFFHASGTRTEEYGVPSEAFIPSWERLSTAAEKYDVHFLPEFELRD
ncbi:quercetin 2,3-dioxygenase [Pseudolysinimonas sp.]